MKLRTGFVKNKAGFWYNGVYEKNNFTAYYFFFFIGNGSFGSDR